MSDPSHILIHHYTPGTGPQEGTPELDAEMKIWEKIDADMRAAGQLVEGWALNTTPVTIGNAEEQPVNQVSFAVHAVKVDDDAAAETLARGMPHLSYGSTTIHPLMK